jgi:hypothetical protein
MIGLPFFHHFQDRSLIMAARCADEVRKELEARGIRRGAAVSWQGFRQMRYGCVTDTSDYDLRWGRVNVIASNGTHSLKIELLTHEPTISDPWRADHDATYPKEVSDACEKQ